jgi:hypothetical protein
MKQSVITNSIFTPSTGTINTNIVDFDVRKLYAIINQTQGILIYATATPAKGYSSVSGSTIVLQHDTSSMSSTDVLQILYEDNEDTNWLQNIHTAVDKLGFLAGLRTALAALRVSVTDGALTSVGTVTTVTGVTTVSTVNTVGSLTNIGAMDARTLVTGTINNAAILSNINNISVTIT